MGIPGTTIERKLLGTALPICDLSDRADPDQTPEAMSRQPQEEQRYPHFALIYVDRNGNLCQRLSESIAERRERIFTPRVRDEFLKAVAISRESQTPQSQRESVLPLNEGV